MKLLAVDTSTPACSAALCIDGAIVEKFTLAPQQHTQLVLPMIDELMAEAQLSPQQLDGLAFGRGPGSFTGVRIATSVVQGIAFGADLPVVPVSTLAALAQDYFNKYDDTEVVFAAMDARIQEIFWGVYRTGERRSAVLLGEEAVTPATNVTFPACFGVGVGSGWKVYATQLSQRLGAWVTGIDSSLLPRAALIAQLGVEGLRCNQAVSFDQALPVYLRDKVAKKESER